jgi:hypothetical protein
MDRQLLVQVREALRTRVQMLDAINVNCSSCREWKKGRCTLADEVPPAAVQAVGCEQWIWDEVPW